MSSRGPLDDDPFRLGKQAGRVAARFQLESGNPAELLDAISVFVLPVFQLGVGGAEDEHLAVLLVARMEGEGGDAAVPVEEEVFAGIGIGRDETVNPAAVLGDQEALRVGVLSDEDGVLEGVLGEDATELVLRRGFG